MNSINNIIYNNKFYLVKSKADRVKVSFVQTDIRRQHPHTLTILPQQPPYLHESARSGDLIG